jgi:hypothetical protein
MFGKHSLSAATAKRRSKRSDFAMTMTPHDLDMMLELAHTHAKHIIIKCNQQLMPSWLVIDARNKGHVIGTPWKDDDEKQIMIAEVRLFMQPKQQHDHHFPR